MIQLAPGRWGLWEYDRTPANETLSPTYLRDYLDTMIGCPEELARQAHISLELATHPQLTTEREHFGDIAMNSYDLLIENGDADLTARFIHTYLPLMLPCTSKTDRKKATTLVRERSVAYANLLIEMFEETEDDGTKRQTIGHAAEQLALTTARQLGYVATPSHYRQDRAIPQVKGKRYAWDLTVLNRQHPETPPILLQVKHRDFDDGMAQYHPDITVHRVFRPEERMNKVAPKVFDLLRAALQLDGMRDGGRFGKYTLTLSKTLAHAQSKTRSTADV